MNLVLAGFAGLAGEPDGAGDNNGGASPPHFLNPLIAQGVSKGGERVNLGRGVNPASPGSLGERVNRVRYFDTKFDTAGANV